MLIERKHAKALPQYQRNITQVAEKQSTLSFKTTASARDLKDDTLKAETFHTLGLVVNNSSLWASGVQSSSNQLSALVYSVY